MGKYKISTIVVLTVLSFNVRKLLARSFENDESANDIDEKVGNIEEWTNQCVCFPKSDIGIPVSKYLTPDVDHERLVVYLYKNRKTNQLTAYIPSWKKQGIFPDLSFDFQDKLDRIPYGGISNIFDKYYFPKSTKGVHLTQYPVPTLVPKEDGISSMKVPGVSNYGINTKPISDNHGKPNKVSIVDGPSEVLPVTISQTSDKITQVSQPNQELNSPKGNIQLPIKGTVIGSVPNEPLKNQNQQMQGTPSLPDGTHTQYFPGKPISNGKNIPVTFPAVSNQSPQKVNLLLDKNMPSVTSSGLEDLLGYGLPRYVGRLQPSKTQAPLIPSKIDIQNPDRPNEIVNVKYSPINYNHPIFNDWLNRQIVNIKPKRSSMRNPLNFHSLRIFLIRTLYENGIRLSQDGNLLDANGNVLKLSNLKIRYIILGDPRDYEKLMATNKCIIPYDIKYLDAILLTLEYPPRILAVIPLSSGNLLSSTSNIQPSSNCVGNCGHCTTCPTNFQSGVSEEDETSSNLNVRISSDANNESSQTSEAASEALEEDNETNNYVYTASNPNVSINVSSDPNETDFQTDTVDLTTLRRALNVGTNDEENNESSPTTKETSDVTDEENELTNSNDIIPESKSGIGNFLSILSPVGLGGVFSNLIPIPHRRKCGQDKCQERLVSSDDDDTSELNNNKELSDMKMPNEDGGGDLHETEERSDTKLKENDSQNEEPQKNDDSNKELHTGESPDSKSDVLILQLKPNDQGVLNGDVIYMDKENGVVEKKPLDDFEVTQETDKKLEDEDYEMLTIRIVGGNPATSSGTPVISRGRSGFIDH